ncbi:uncharacterized protein LOC126564283 [Anopheles maculipalpis]|uniref:uncharacterized protein LOC126564283 n=1 Tax=Anopheles maculipalpis TaxID=1496333 RepID=UPI002158B670|nr:uncharacterized protein LOC126564283 [Anopheles maculipalpis]
MATDEDEVPTRLWLPNPSHYPSGNPLTASTNFYVIPELSAQPTRTIKKDDLNLPLGMVLADENFNHPGPIDAILGAGICFDSASFHKQSCHNATCIDDLKSSLERFWKVEELPPDVTNQKGLLDRELEEHFKTHTRIADDGRYIVRIPLRGELNQLGDSIEQAQRRLLSLERKLSRHEDTYVEYRKFMREYLDLGHMVPVPAEKTYRLGG